MHVRTLALLAALALPAPLLATSYTYTYTGQDFTSVTGPYTTSDSVTGYFTLSSPLADNLGFPSYVSPTTFSFSDGVDTITNNSPGASISLFVGTNATGGITAWNIQVEDYASYSYICIVSQCGYTNLYNIIQSFNTDGSSGDFDYFLATGYFPSFYEGEASNFSAGLLTSNATPEPPSLFLLATGLAGAAAFLRRKSQSSAPASPHSL